MISELTYELIPGPIMSVTVFGQHIVILSDARLAFEMLDKRSVKYSDRPTLIFGGEMYVLCEF